jgi:hypothetical protein
MDKHCKNGNGNNGQSNETPLNMWKLLLRSSPSMTIFTMHFALKLVYLLKQLIESGRTLRETSRSKSRVE